MKHIVFIILLFFSVSVFGQGQKKQASWIPFSLKKNQSIDPSPIVCDYIDVPSYLLKKKIRKSHPSYFRDGILLTRVPVNIRLAEKENSLNQHSQ